MKKLNITSDEFFNGFMAIVMLGMTVLFIRLFLDGIERQDPVITGFFSLFLILGLLGTTFFLFKPMHSNYKERKPTFLSILFAMLLMSLVIAIIFAVFYGIGWLILLIT